MAEGRRKRLLYLVHCNLKPHRVLLMARELTFGGSERQMTEIALALDRSRFTPVVACFHSEGIRGDELRAAGVPVLELPVHSFKSPAWLRGAMQFARYIRREQVSIVHAWDYPTTAFAIPIARAFTNAVTISSQRGHRTLTPRGYLRVVRWTDRMADGIVVNCDFLKRHLVQDYGVPPRAFTSATTASTWTVSAVLRPAGPPPFPTTRWSSER